MDNKDYSRRDFIKLMGVSAAALALPEFDFFMEKKKPAKIGLQLYTIRREIEKDFSAAIKKAAEIGYSGVETYALPSNITLEQAAKVFKSNELKVFSMHTDMPEGEQRDAIVKMADIYQCNRVVFAGYPEGEKYKDMDTIKRTAERYNEAASFLKTNELKFGLHNHWWEFEKKPDGFTPFYYLLENLSKDIFFELDTYWVKVGGKDPAKAVAEFGSRAPLLHIKDGPAIKGDKTYEQQPAGKGAMDIPAIVNAAKGNTEWMIVEFDEYAGNIFEGIKSSYTYLTENKLAKGNL
ncbi:MAG TPA: TIM barrel protein [Ignavibacteriales bacterium]|nr:TIM barrel protein [Ignavibacteriales bacterium]